MLTTRSVPVEGSFQNWRVVVSAGRQPVCPRTPHRVWTVGWNVDLLTGLQLALLAVNEVAERAVEDIECLGLEEVDVVGWRRRALSSDARVRVPSPETLARGKRLCVLAHLPCLQCAVEEMPHALLVNVRSLQVGLLGGHCSAATRWVQTGPAAHHGDALRWELG